MTVYSLSWFDAKVHMNILHFPFLWPACFARKKYHSKVQQHVQWEGKCISYDVDKDYNQIQLDAWRHRRPNPVHIQIFNSHWASPLIKSQLKIDRFDQSFRSLLPTFLSHHPRRRTEVKHLISMNTLSWKDENKVFFIGFWGLASGPYNGTCWFFKASERFNSSQLGWTFCVPR